MFGDGLSLDRKYLSCCRSNGKYSKGTWYVLVEKEQVVSALIVYSGTFEGLQKGVFGLGFYRDASPTKAQRLCF